MKKVEIKGKTIEYEMLEEKNTMSMREVISLFETGAVLLYLSQSEPNLISVLGWIKYQPGLKEEDIRSVLMKEKEIQILYSYQMMVIKPTRVDKTSKNGYWVVERVENELYEFITDDSKVIKPPLAPIMLDIQEWVERSGYNELRNYLCNRVKGQEDVEYLAAEVFVYLKAISQGKQIHNNVILAAPSGCGKTEVYRALRDYFKCEIPELVIDQVDMSNITEAAYRGAEPNSIISALLDKPELNGVGIIFLDEFDKKLMPSWSSRGNINLAVQGQLLTIIEGSKQTFHCNVNGRHSDTQIDTSNTMFIACGAFDFIRKKLTQKKKIVGFNRMDEQDAQDYYLKISKDDMAKAGASHELLGRFSSVVNFHKLNSDVVNEIIDGFLEKLSDELECKVTISDAYREELHTRSNSKYGCRDLESTIREDAMKGYIKILQEDSREASTVYLNSIDDVVIVEEKMTGHEKRIR